MTAVAIAPVQATMLRTTIDYIYLQVPSPWVDAVDLGWHPSGRADAMPASATPTSGSHARGWSSLATALASGPGHS
ncbi:hypothetical protein B296_00020487 [Ensete ventricosum]|uniref:Uncharacterized protein n=1 Tax=Ensete ventricosum TaxID=4639 RepID=A0A426ZKI7_ENSVE|nr:hypothetical protein B296_00020487 [Ensete ventricosum]